MIKSKRRVLKYLVNTRVINDFGALRTHEESSGKYDESKNVDNSKGIVKWGILYNNFINRSENIRFKAVQIHQ
ncbi:hypothetical protein K4R79_10440 [Staphylococcus epidermidis]|nr:hypothetical protein [Staphylococcus epidermidis]MCG1876009.1 hypothetical protein [Staphylococcus epidermidis]MCG2112311.1 hypothetical protein [Staphylococcus epidermidis]